MRVYSGMDPRLPARRRWPPTPAGWRRLGFDGLHVAETVHDSLAVALLAAEHTERITVRTSVTLAFPRSPTLTAYAAWDLAAYSRGRFQLGLGTQIRQNIEDRYGMAWAEPVARLREYVEALARPLRGLPHRRQDRLPRAATTGSPGSSPTSTRGRTRP